MRKLTSSLVGTSLLAVALSVVAVGVVWAGSSARQFLVNDSTETTVPTEGEIPDLIPDDSLPPSEVLELINELTATVAELEEKVDAYESDIQAARSDAAKARAAADAATEKIETAVDEAAIAIRDAAAATAAANEAKAQVALFQNRLSKLTDEGVYTGTITPSQLSRRLVTSDINGDWPLERTNGELNGDKVKVSGSSCWSDYRYNVFIVPETFRGLTCFRVLK
jgi:polyhydroxyalkanoate synthesis regulator phasin